MFVTKILAWIVWCRWRHCSYHCLQLLAARALVFMAGGGPGVQTQLVQEPQLRILVSALDSTHDPQLLVLVLQLVAQLALEPAHQRALLEHGLPDALSQLLLPSDEWYYTNHSTKYARFVKHHAARALVYLGLQHRVNPRLSVYDVLQEEAPPPTPLLESLEDEYIAATSAPPSAVVDPHTSRTLGLSVENAILQVLKAFENSLNQGTPLTELSTLHWVLSGSTYEEHQNRVSAPTTATTTTTITTTTTTTTTAPTGSCCWPRASNGLGTTETPSLVRSLVACLPCVVSPVVVIRLLLHRLLTTAAPLHRWKSCASRSSFASAQQPEAPRSPRSRASSTDTEPSSLRKRRKVIID